MKVYLMAWLIVLSILLCVTFWQLDNAYERIANLTYVVNGHADAINEQTNKMNEIGGIMNHNDTLQMSKINAIIDYLNMGVQ